MEKIRSMRRQNRDFKEEQKEKEVVDMTSKKYGVELETSEKDDPVRRPYQMD